MRILTIPLPHLIIKRKKRSDLSTRENDSRVAHLELALIGTESFACSIGDFPEVFVDFAFDPDEVAA